MDAIASEREANAIRSMPVPANLDLATTFHDEGILTYRNRLYRVRPVPYRNGIGIMALAFELRQLGQYEPTDEVVRQTHKVVMALLDEFWLLIIPPWWMRFVPKRWRRNPFRDAELPEIEALVSFFSPARMRYPVMGRRSVRAPAWASTTWLTDSPSLRVGIHAGWRRTARPAVTSITSWGWLASAMNPSDSPGFPSR
jgi:hypothetical protein